MAGRTNAQQMPRANKSHGLSGTDIGRLPRGRHNLTRDEVEASQRLRLAVGMAEACAEVGFAGISVKAVLQRAGVSRLTFYELYSDLLDCFLDTLDFVAEVLINELVAAGSWQANEDHPQNAAAGSQGAAHSDSHVRLERASRVIDRYLESLCSNLAFARLVIIEVHAAGPDALRRRLVMQQRMVAALAELLDASTPRSRFVCEAYVASVSALVTLPVATQDVDAIWALRGPLVDLLGQQLQLIDADRNSGTG